MDIPEKNEIIDIQIWVEWCIKKLYSKEAIIEKIHVEKKVPKLYIQLVLEELEKQNPDFFEAYHLRSRIRKQLILHQFLIKENQNVLHPPKIALQPEKKSLNKMNSWLY